MSIVPYNYNSEIVYHDPNYGILVLHNNQQNSIQLLSTIDQPDRGQFRRHSSEPFNTNNFEIPREHDSNECPNCGFRWSHQRYQKRRNNESPAMTSSSLDSPGEMVPVSKSRYPLGFMHNDYFKVLANLPFDGDKYKLASPNSSIKRLPKEIFNQGYFKRFFKKIPPYVLGSGAHAQVYKVMHVLNEIQLGTYAIKRISIGDHSTFLDQVLTEVLILYELSTQGANENNLIRYNHVWLEMGDINDLNTYFLPNDDGDQRDLNSKVPYVFILQQYAGGGHLEELISKNFQKEKIMSLKDKVGMERMKRRMKKGSIPQEKDGEDHHKRWLSDFEIWKFFKDVANGVNYLHLKGILHRDLKPSNCLLDVEYDSNGLDDLVTFNSVSDLEQLVSIMPKVLVSDFGEGKFIDKQYLANKHLSSSSEERQGNTGTLEFTAPELWLFANYDPSAEHERQRFVYGFTYSSDIYSLGLILCWLCVGSLPFSSYIIDRTNPDQVRESIAQWYFDLNASRFRDWFTSQIEGTRGTRDFYTEPLQDFEKLIYLMIKGNNGDFTRGIAERINCAEVMKFLDAIKWKRFIKPNKSKIHEMDPNEPQSPINSYTSSEASSPREPKSSGNSKTHKKTNPQNTSETHYGPEDDDDDLDYEDNLVQDLTDIEVSDLPIIEKDLITSQITQDGSGPWRDFLFTYQQHISVLLYVSAILLLDRLHEPHIYKHLVLVFFAGDVLLVSHWGFRVFLSVLVLVMVATLSVWKTLM